MSPEIIPSQDTLERLKALPMKQLGPAISLIIHDAVADLMAALAPAIAVAETLAERTGSDHADYDEARDALWSPRPAPTSEAEAAPIVGHA